MRPSSVTVQAPQSPVPQPSLAPVRPRRLRSTSSRGSSGVAEEFDGVAVDVVATLDRFHFCSSGAVIGDFCGAAGEDAGHLGAEFDRAALVVDGLAGGGGGLCQRRQGRVVKLGADEGLCGSLDQQDGRGNGAQGHAGGGHGAARRRASG